MKTRIHVNQHKIRRNTKNGTQAPVLTVKTYQCNRYMNGAAILDKDGNEVARVIYSPDRPLPCGAKCWIETDLKVERAEIGREATTPTPGN